MTLSEGDLDKMSARSDTASGGSTGGAHCGTQAPVDTSPSPLLSHKSRKAQVENALFHLTKLLDLHHTQFEFIEEGTL